MQILLTFKFLINLVSTLFIILTLALVKVGANLKKKGASALCQPAPLDKAAMLFNAASGCPALSLVCHALELQCLHPIHATRGTAARDSVSEANNELSKEAANSPQAPGCSVAVVQTGFGSRQFTLMAVYSAIAAVCLALLIAMLGRWLHGFRLVYTQHKYWAKRRLRCTGLVAVQAAVEVSSGCPASTRAPEVDASSF